MISTIQDTVNLIQLINATKITSRAKTNWEEKFINWLERIAYADNQWKVALHVILAGLKIASIEFTVVIDKILIETLLMTQPLLLSGLKSKNLLDVYCVLVYQSLINSSDNKLQADFLTKISNFLINNPEITEHKAYFVAYSLLNGWHEQSEHFIKEMVAMLNLLKTQSPSIYKPTVQQLITVCQIGSKKATEDQKKLASDITKYLKQVNTYLANKQDIIKLSNYFVAYSINLDMTIASADTLEVLLARQDERLLNFPEEKQRCIQPLFPFITATGTELADLSNLLTRFYDLLTPTAFTAEMVLQQNQLLIMALKSTRQVFSITEIINLLQACQLQNGSLFLETCILILTAIKDNSRLLADVNALLPLVKTIHHRTNNQHIQMLVKLLLHEYNLTNFY